MKLTKFYKNCAINYVETSLSFSGFKSDLGSSPKSWILVSVSDVRGDISSKGLASMSWFSVDNGMGFSLKLVLVSVSEDDQTMGSMSSLSGDCWMGPSPSLLWDLDLKDCNSLLVKDVAVSCCNWGFLIRVYATFQRIKALLDTRGYSSDETVSSSISDKSILFLKLWT